MILRREKSAWWFLPESSPTSTKVLEMGHHESGSESVFSGFESFGSSSSSSDLSTLVGSELDSTEVESDDEEDEFMAELTRQMADYMLQEDEDKEEEAADCDSENFKDTDGQGIKDTSVISSSVEEPNTSGFHSTPASTGDQMPRIQFYQLENQPRVTNNGSMSVGRRGKRTESTHQLQHDKKQDHKQINMGRANDMGNYGKAYQYGVGSGMRAVFLGGIGSRNASIGTGVFLPRPISSTPDQSRKKSRCSTVLIPTRVLQALDQHFSNIESSSPSSGSNGHPARHGRRDNTQEKRQTQSQPRAAVDHQVSQLPQEWTY